MIPMLREYLIYLSDQVHYSYKSIPPDLLAFLMKSDTDNPSRDGKQYFNRVATSSRYRVKELEKSPDKSLRAAANFIRSNSLMWIHTVGEIEFWFSMSNKNIFLWNMEQGKFIGSQPYRKWMGEMAGNYYGV